MTILAFPTIASPSAVSWWLRGNTQTHRSPFDGTAQTLSMPGARWEASVQWEILNGEDRRALEAFIASLEGAAGRFYFGPPHGFRRGTGTGPVTIKTAGQTGKSLVTTGWTGGTPFEVGDWLSFEASGRRYLHIVTVPGTPAGGDLTCGISPPIRRSPAAGSVVEIAAPTGIFMLASDDAGEMQVRAPQLGAVSLDIVEALA
jgi:hypothetical protein